MGRRGVNLHWPYDSIMIYLSTIQMHLNISHLKLTFKNASTCMTCGFSVECMYGCLVKWDLSLWLELIFFLQCLSQVANPIERAFILKAATDSLPSFRLGQQSWQHFLNSSLISWTHFMVADVSTWSKLLTWSFKLLYYQGILFLSGRFYTQHAKCAQISTSSLTADLCLPPPTYKHLQLYYPAEAGKSVITMGWNYI